MKQALRRLVWTLIAATVLACALSTVAVIVLSSELSTYTQKVAPLVAMSQQLRAQLTAAQSDYRGYLISHDPSYLDRFAHDRTEFEHAQEAYDAIAAPVVGAGRAEELRTRGVAWFAQTEVQIAVVQAGGAGNIAISSRVFDEFIASHDEVAERLGAVQQRRETRILTAMRVTIGGTALLGVLVAGGMAWYGSRATNALVRPLRALHEVVAEHRRGKVDARADPGAGALEINTLASVFNDLADANAAYHKQQQRNLALHDATGRATALLSTAPSAGGGWTRACELVGHALEADRVAVYSGQTMPDIQALGSWPPADPGDDPRRLREEDVVVLASTVAADSPADIERLLPHSFAELARGVGIRSWLLVPIVLVGELRGAISIWRRNEQAWAHADVEAAERFAQHAAHRITETDYIESLRELDRQKSDFMATTSHELRTPLTSIGGYLEMLEDGDFGPLSDPQRRTLGIIDRNVARLRGLIEDLLILNRIDSGRGGPKFAELDLSLSVRQIVENLEPVAARADVTILAHTPERGVTVDADREQVERAITNIVNNAVKFTPGGGQVRVRLDVVDAQVRLVVTDTGIGIPKEDLDGLFGRFFRARNAASKAIPGTGLGLAIVRAIIDAHGGTVAIESLENEGTTVVIELPRRQITVDT